MIPSTRLSSVRRAAALACVACAATAPAVHAQAPSGPTGLAPAPAQANLTHSYFGNDGGQLFLYRAGSRVTGFGERGGAAYVLDGTIADGKVSGQTWDVAKGKRTGAGAFALTIQDAGNRLIPSGAAFDATQTFNAVDKIGDLHQWKEAGFQATTSNDLDGAFAAPGYIPGYRRAYLRQSGSTVAGIIEHGFAGGATRPDYALAFVGTRGADDRLSGHLVGVPKGGIAFEASFTGTVAKDRSFTISAVHPDGDVFMTDQRFVPDYAVDLDRFAANLRAALDGKTVGWSFGVAQDGKLVRNDAGGRRAVAGVGDYTGTDKKYTVYTENEIASTSKTVTAVAVARALNDRGKTLDEKVAPYLPASWKKGPGMKTVTFRQMLRHQGLVHPGGICKTDPYACLQKAVEGGMTAKPGYNNIHFTLMRVVLPFIVRKGEMTALFADKKKTGAQRNTAFSKVFRTYVVDMLDAKGIEADFVYTGSNRAIGYKFGPPISGGVLPGGNEETAGSGGIRITAHGFTRFLAAFQHGQFVPISVVQDMKDSRVGFDNQKKDFVAKDAIGELLTKNGGTSYVGSQLMMYPGDTQAFISVNSTGNPMSESLARTLRTAWQNALV